MKVKLVKFVDLDCNGSKCTDYGLPIGHEYEVFGCNSSTGEMIILNDFNEEITIYDSEYEVVND